MTTEQTNEEYSELPIQDIKSEMKDEEYTPLKYDIAIYPADYTLEVLYLKWQKNEIVIPKFQRGYVWNIAQASRLIESFMMGLPIPPIFFYVQADQKNLVIDGSQRLRTVFYFFEGLFGEPDNSGRRREFKLEGINHASKLYKKSFKELDESDQRLLKNVVLRSMLVKQIHPTNNDTSIYHIFERLNTGGTMLMDQEVRNCVYSGKLNELLLELNKYKEWRRILGKEKRDIRQKDVQLILRCLALFHESENYEKPMKEFLSGFMSGNRDPSDQFIQEDRMRFKKACDLLVKNLGERPFNPKGPLNPSFLDSVLVAFLKRNDACPADISERFRILKENADFLKLISDATTDREVVLRRLAMAQQILFE